jgi:hypothetical protein
MGIIGFTIIIYSFYENLDKDIPFYINPFSIIVLCGTIPLSLFVGVFFLKQLILVSKGINTKQQKSIKESNCHHNYEKLPLSQRIINIYKFLRRSQSESLINHN